MGGLLKVEVTAAEYADVIAGSRRAVLCMIDTMVQVGDWLHLRSSADRDGVPIMAEVVGVHRHPEEIRSHLVLVSLGLVGFPPLMQIRLPRPVVSLKNRRSLGWRKLVRPGKVTKRVPMSRKSDEQNRDIDMVRRYAQVEVSRKLAGTGDRMPFAADDAVRVDVLHLIEADEIVVRAIRIGKLPKGSKKAKRGTKRDVHGLQELIADALNGVWWGDDAQIDRSTQERIR